MSGEQASSYGTRDLADVRARLERAVSRYAAAWSPEAREDLVSKATIKVLAAFERDPDKALNASYLYRVAYSVTVDEARRRQRRPAEPLAEDVHRHPDPGPSQPDRGVWAQQVAAAVRDCLEQAPADRRRVVGLYLQGHGRSEIGGVLRWQQKRVDNLLYRGLASLRRCLEAKGIRP